MVELIITEKPKAAQKIAEALAEGKVEKKQGRAKGVYYYEITRGNTDVIVGCAVGHLFGLAEKVKKGMKYPQFDIDWKPTHETSKGAAFTKKYFDTLKSLAKKADSFIVSTDLDIEGEVIGANVLKYICKQKDAKRMKFSTLTPPDLVKAYDEASPTLEWGMANAGEVRHHMDWYYGINLSRALTVSIKKAGFFKLLSIGRVQGPALHIIVDKEKEIKVFKPEPFWQLELNGEVNGGKLFALHEKDKFWKEKEAELSYKNSKGKGGKIAAVKRSEYKQMPPTPFDLTTLQTEAYRVFGAPPKATLQVAQELYTAGLISYPRTSSQQLPPSIGYKKILGDLSKQKDYSSLCQELINQKKLEPRNGKKTDPAHPAIYPTGVSPKKVEERSGKIYDLIVRRFMATFADPAIRATVTAKIDVNGEVFVSSGTTTKIKGWHEFYGQYARFKEEELPVIKEGEAVKVKKLEMLQKETKPPPRYTQASIVRELEKRNLGTKATRAEVVDTLYKRGYVDGKAIEATELGVKIIDTLEKYSPLIIDEEMTRHFELEMEEILDGKKKNKEVLDEAKKTLTKILKEFSKKEDNIGKALIDATKTAEDKANTVGKCTTCKGTLMIKKGKLGRFIACTEYPKCTTTFKLPANALIKTTEDVCEDCTLPKVMLIKKARRPQIVCINPDCKSKISEDVMKEIKEKENETCEKCNDGKMIIRKSIYGSFLACDGFPKCRNIARLKSANNKWKDKKSI